MDPDSANRLQPLICLTALRPLAVLQLGPPLTLVNTEPVHELCFLNWSVGSEPRFKHSCGWLQLVAEPTACRAPVTLLPDSLALFSLQIWGPRLSSEQSPSCSVTLRWGGRWVGEPCRFSCCWHHCWVQPRAPGPLVTEDVEKIRSDVCGHAWKELYRQKSFFCACPLLLFPVS